MTGEARISESQIEAEILLALAKSDQASSACPSQIARALAPVAWRMLMPRIRHVAARMAHDELVVITRGSSVLSPTQLEGGPIRIRRGARFHHPEKS